MNVLSRFWNQLFELQTVEAGASTTVPDEGSERQMLLARVAELERQVEHQHARVHRAKSLLQNAGFLARYHQPTLARDINGWIEEVNGSGDGAAAGVAAPARPAWAIKPSAPSDRISA